MSKLFPPILENKLPAQSGESLSIPFKLNPAVGTSDTSQVIAILKSAQTNREIGTVIGTYSNSGYQMGLASFDLGDLASSFIVGQYYKVQIAYYKNNSAGYYSTAGIIKYTSNPILTILELEEGPIDSYSYTGQYSNIADETEKVQSYCFNLYENKKLIDSSGVLIHDSSNDEIVGISQDTWAPNIELQQKGTYELEYKITTKNGIEASITRPIEKTAGVDMTFPIKLLSSYNDEDGSIILSLLTTNEEDTIINGSFKLLRSSNISNFQKWEEVYRFTYTNIVLKPVIEKVLWEDRTLCHGETYLYAIQAYNSWNFHSNKLYSSSGKITANFEDAYLCDNDYQLRIRFNPQITNFKNNILESKVETLGSKYPFIFRNGNVSYKEFSISGLLSLNSDLNGKFMKLEEEKLISQRPSTPGPISEAYNRFELSDLNIYNERQFKLKVLDWLNNGQPKIFRSPTEGNYIVRLMNSSLTPNDTLGRMLHTFSSTAYEIADWNLKNLLSLELIKISDEANALLNKRIGQIRPRDLVSSNNLANDFPDFSFKNESTKATINFPVVQGVKIVDAIPGTQLKIWFRESTSPQVFIEIGDTGTYNFQQEAALQAIGLHSGKWGDMKINFEYYDDIPSDSFGGIVRVHPSTEIRRIIGKNYNDNLIQTTSSAADSNAIISDIRRSIGVIRYLKAEKRYVERIWKNAGDPNCYRNESMTDLIKNNEWNPVVIYHNVITDLYYDGKVATGNQIIPDFRFSLNTSSGTNIEMGGYITEAPTEDDSIDMLYGNTFGRIEGIKNVDEITSLNIGNGVLVDICYSVLEKEYSVESQNSTVLSYKNNWTAGKKLYEICITNSTITTDEYKDLQTKLSSTGDGLLSKYLTYNTAAKVYEVSDEFNAAAITTLINFVNATYASFITHLSNALKS